MPHPHHWIVNQDGTICKECFSPVWAQHGDCPGNPEVDAMRAELEHLRTENAELRKASKPAAKAKP